MTFGHFHLEVQEIDGVGAQPAGRVTGAGERTNP
jgi:hypothetical protein